jgi:hypothetical protein
MEVHERPERAKSDAQNALKLSLLEPLLTRLVRIDAIARETREVGSKTTASGERASAYASAPARSRRSASRQGGRE